MDQLPLDNGERLDHEDETRKKEEVVVGSRGSQLAIIQARKAIKKVGFEDLGYKVSVEEIVTTGDRRQDAALGKIGATSVFTKELELCLLEGKIGVAVHSLKDVACSPIPGLVIAAYIEREDPRDCMILKSDLKKQGITLRTLAPGSIVGTSSARRAALVGRHFPHLQTENIRGSISTRLKKLESGAYSAILLSIAALIRMDMADKADEIFPVEMFTPAPGQGCIAMQCRSDDREMVHLLKEASHSPTEICCIAERSFMRAVMAGCTVPVGAHAVISTENIITIRGVILSGGGEEMYTATVSAPVHTLVPGNRGKNVVVGESVGRKLKDELEKMGARPLIDTLLSAPNGRQPPHREYLREDQSNKETDRP